MLLPDHTIREHCNGYALISPFHDENLQPASYDLTLSEKFLYPGGNETPFRSNRYSLKSGEMILGSTVERLRLPPYIAGQIQGKSGHARRGLQIESAGHVDPGYKGTVTLEIVNLGPRVLLLIPGMLIAKIVFHRLETPCRRPYSVERNAHQYAHGPTG